MPRSLLVLLCCLILALLVYCVCGCSAASMKAWEQNHTAAGFADQGSKLGTSALASFTTGNPLPFIMASGQFVGWLIGGGAGAVAAVQTVRMKKRQKPWTEQQRQQYRQNQAMKSAQSQSHNLTAPALPISGTTAGDVPPLKAAA